MERSPFDRRGQRRPPSRQRRTQRRALSLRARRADRRPPGTVRRRVDGLFVAGGPAFRRLGLSHAASVAGDTLVAIALAGTLFFTVPSAEARGNVALYLLLTLAPFALLAPVLGALLVRFPTAYRYGLVSSGTLRAALALVMATQLGSLWLYPLAFGLLVLSRLHGISRSSLLPVALDEPRWLVAANARLAQVGVIAGAAAVPIGAANVRFVGSWAVLVLAAILFVAAAVAAAELPAPPEEEGQPLTRDIWQRITNLPRAVRIAQLATAGVRFLNGFLLLLLAFAFRDVDAGLIDFGALLAAAGGGFFVAALISPWLERRLREEPMVVAALALEAGAAFVAAQAFGLSAAAALAAAAGLAWGTAKFAFDDLLQTFVHPAERGVAFTRAETLFQIAWVAGALLPVLVVVPAGFGLLVAGLAALSAQVIYVAGLLIPPSEPDDVPATTGAGP